jgi:hypothetical protein
MFSNRVIRLSLIVCFMGCGSFAEASPVGYAFSGTLAQPFDGSTQFSGTFKYDTNLPPDPNINPSPGWSYYLGTPTDPSSPPVSLTFNLGNTSSSSFGSADNIEVVVAHTPSSDGFFINEQFPFQGRQNLTAEIGLANNNLAQPGPFKSSSLPSSLNLTDFSIGGNLTFWGTTADGQQVNVVGTVTSLVPDLNAPETATLAVFIVLGAGLCLHRAVLRISSGHSTPRTQARFL